ncbi:MAG: hypothetical protein WC405_08250 [Syntrophales bacterium]
MGKRESATTSQLYEIRRRSWARELGIDNHWETIRRAINKEIRSLGYKKKYLTRSMHPIANAPDDFFVIFIKELSHAVR